MPVTEKYRNSDGVEVPAFQYSGQEHADFPWWMKERSNYSIEERSFGENDKQKVLVLQTLDGEEVVKSNDWVIETPRGEVKLVRGDRFDEVFVPASESNALPKGNLSPESMADPSTSSGSERIGTAQGPVDNPESAKEQTSTRARRRG